MHDDAVTLGIKNARKRAGISQEELAERVGVRQQSVQAWESGRAMPSAEKLSVLADALSTTADELLGREGAVTSADADLEELRENDPEQYDVIVAQLRIAAQRARARRH